MCLGIKEALEDRAWFHAWCGHCSTAKPAVERRCTDGGRLPNIVDFVCEDCQTQRAQAAEQAAAERRRLEQLLEQYENDGDDERRVDARRRLAELESVQVDGEAQYVVRACPNEACGVMIAKVRLAFCCPLGVMLMMRHRNSDAITSNVGRAEPIGVGFARRSATKTQRTSTIT